MGLFLTNLYHVNTEKYWCWVPELKNLTSNERLSLAIPLDHEGYSRCNMYDVNYTLILLNESYVPNPLWPTKTCQHGWEFNYSDVPYATVATKIFIQLLWQFWVDFG
ncbi:carcinine transporter-like [Apis mellifera caucasica]|nr:carcinine transporter-like [Apis mellifera caucasica]